MNLEESYKRILDNGRKVFIEIPQKKRNNNISGLCILRNPLDHQCCFTCKYNKEFNRCNENSEIIIEMIKKDLRKERLEKLLS